MRTYVKKSTDPRVESLEEKFQDAQRRGDIEAMQLCMCDCVENIIKRLITGHRVSDDLLEERTDEAKLVVLQWFHNKLAKDPTFKIKRLVNAIWLQTIYSYRSVRHQREDKEVSLNQALEDNEIDLSDFISYQEWSRYGLSGGV